MTLTTITISKMILLMDVLRGPPRVSTLLRLEIGIVNWNVFVLRMVISSHHSPQHSSRDWSLWIPSLMSRVWKSEISLTTQYHMSVLKCGSIQESPLISIFRKSRQSCLVTKLEKLYGFDGYQTLRSRLTVLSLRQDLVHGTLLQCHLIFWVILKPSLLANCFFRSSHWVRSTPCWSAPILPLWSNHPVFTRHPGYVISRGFFLLYILFTDPIQGPGHPIFVFARVYGRDVDLQDSSSNMSSFTWFFSSPHKVVFRNFPSAIRTHLIRIPGDSSFMFVVSGCDLIVLIYLYVHVMCLGVTWWVFMFEP